LLNLKSGLTNIITHAQESFLSVISTLSNSKYATNNL